LYPDALLGKALQHLTAQIGVDEGADGLIPLGQGRGLGADVGLHVFDLQLGVLGGELVKGLNVIGLGTIEQNLHSGQLLLARSTGLAFAPGDPALFFICQRFYSSGRERGKDWEHWDRGDLECFYDTLLLRSLSPGAIRQLAKKTEESALCIC
jgi:hypothetical protein